MTVAMNSVDELFRWLRSTNQKAFIPFVAAGDPDMAATGRLIRELNAAGVHVIEVGFPFSDPIADGPVIQAAYTRALERGLKVDDVFAGVEKLSGLAAPLVGMTSYSLIHRRGPAEFLRQARSAGFAGLIVPDLPVEEAGALAERARDLDLRLVLLVTPTTTPARAERIVRAATGFVYCVSVAGITGERDQLPDELRHQLQRLRTMTDLPLCVGFGISRPEHVHLVREYADGVIVGSAIVRRVEQVPSRGWDGAIGDIRELVRSLMAALNPAIR
jgi:tryptophan synthase alpha chain